MVILSIMFRWAMILGVVFAPKLCFSQPQKYAPEDIALLQKQAPKPMVFFIHTDWCGFCQAMKTKTLQNDEVVARLNQKYYFIDFNAEQKEEVVFAGQIFRFQPTGVRTGVHQLAEALATINGQLSYPALIILNEKYEIVFQYAGFVTVKELLQILQEIEQY